MTVVNNKLTIEVDLGVAGAPSVSGKTIVLASTKGNARLPGAAGVAVGLNVYMKP